MYSFWVLITAILYLHSASCSAQNSTAAEYNMTDQGLYGGDILLTPEQRATIEATANINDPNSPQMAVVRNMRSIWPNAVVPYVIDSSLGELNSSNQSYMHHRELCGEPALPPVAIYYIPDAEKRERCFHVK